jgi:hypothetical protein
MAKQPSGLRPDQEKFLCEANQEGVFDFNLLKLGDASCSHPVVFLGENHAKSGSGRKRGEEALVLFPLRALEGANPAQYKKLKSSLYVETFLALIRELQKAPPNIIAHSVVFEARKNGINVDSAGKVSVMGQVIAVPFALDADKKTWLNFLALLEKTDQKTLAQSSCNATNAAAFRSLDVLREDPYQILDIMKPVFDKNGWEGINLPLEFGELESYDAWCGLPGPQCDSYMITERNKLMAKNIQKIVAHLPCGIPLTVMTGAAHIGGITKLLEKSKATPVLSGTYYRDYGRD